MGGYNLRELQFMVDIYNGVCKPTNTTCIWIIQSKLVHIYIDYPLANVYIAMENHHFQWVNQLFLWPFSMAVCLFTRPGRIHGGCSYSWMVTSTHPSYPECVAPWWAPTTGNLDFKRQGSAKKYAICSTEIHMMWFLCCGWLMLIVYPMFIPTA